ncbi:MAG: GNAT family N-acetyltransferase [Deltaproteobacteria bacterium]|nr:GNAT family N-acetyltransferase [Deltaproteobacteria bacterium]
MVVVPRAAIPRLDELDLRIETQRLVLRPYVEGDVDALWPSVSDPEFPRMMMWPVHAHRDDTLAYIRGTAEDVRQNVGVTWGIELEGRAIGSIGLRGIVWQVGACRADRAELGYWVAKAWWGKGIMTEAAHAAVGFGFETIGLHKISTACFVENAASRRVIEKVGFRHVGRVEDDLWRDGAWHAQHRYELTSPEWSDVHTTMRVSRPRPT